MLNKPYYPLLALLGLGLAGCQTPTAQAPVGMANPASVFCAEQGGELVIVEGKGGQYGECRFSDGTVVEEWEYYRRHH